MNCLVTRRYNLSLLHSIPADMRENSPVHGHDFKLEVTWSGPLDRRTGQIVSRDVMDQIVRDEILRPFDKTLVNEKVRFGTGEDLVQEFLKRLRNTKTGAKVIAVQLTETRKNRYQGWLENSDVST